MNIAPISMAQNYKANAASFNCDSPKPLVNDKTPKDEVICFSNWGGNYVYPITAGDVKAAASLKAEMAAQMAIDAAKAEADAYTQEKLYSAEWST